MTGCNGTAINPGCPIRAVERAIKQSTAPVSLRFARGLNPEPLPVAPSQNQFRWQPTQASLGGANGVMPPPGSTQALMQEAKTVLQKYDQRMAWLAQSGLRNREPPTQSKQQQQPTAARVSAENTLSSTKRMLQSMQAPGTDVPGLVTPPERRRRLGGKDDQQVHTTPKAEEQSVQQRMGLANLLS